MPWDMDLDCREIRKEVEQWRCVSASERVPVTSHGVLLQLKCLTAVPSCQDGQNSLSLHVDIAIKKRTYATVCTKNFWKEKERQRHRDTDR